MGITSSDQVRKLSLDYEKCGGACPDGIPRPWETEADLKERFAIALRRYLGYHHVIVGCHGMVIRSQVSAGDIPPGGIFVCDWPPT